MEVGEWKLGRPHTHRVSCKVDNQGIVFVGLEVSRLARDNADWHQLLRIAGITDTLILDETGIYDPNDSNDRLLLGLLCGT